MRILLVDDEPAIREQLGAMLTSQRYILNTAVDGEQALDFFYQVVHQVVGVQVAQQLVGKL